MYSNVESRKSDAFKGYQISNFDSYLSIIKKH